MQLIKPSFEILEQGPGLQGIYKQIELAGRTCYKSLDKITEDSAEGFVNRMTKSQHYAMLEHGTVYLKYDIGEHCSMNFPNKYRENNYSTVRIDVEGLHGDESPEYKEKFSGHLCAYITTNMRVLVENSWLDDLQYLCEPTEFHEKRVTVRFTTDRGVSHEFVRHRVFSFAMESTRYCNYSKDKFGNELTFIIPSWLEEDKMPRGTIINHDDWGDLIGEYYFHLTGKESSFFKHSEVTPEMNFAAALQVSEQLYLELINQGWKPQQARQVLPNALKTELVMTGFVSDWNHFFDLRARGTTGAPHPDAKALAEPLMHEFEKRRLI